MDPKIQTSFIPKKSLATVAKSQSANTSGTEGGISIVFLIALIIFISVLALAIGVFLYQQFLFQDIENKKVSLDRARSAFEPTLIEEMSRLDFRMKSASEILNNHKALSEFFSLLENTTLVSIQFKDFNYNIDESERISISMNGVASNFNSVALQSDIFGDNKFIQEPIFSNLNLDKKGDIVFDFTAFIDPKLLSYKDTKVSSNVNNQ